MGHASISVTLMTLLIVSCHCAPLPPVNDVECFKRTFSLFLNVVSKSKVSQFNDSQLREEIMLCTSNDINLHPFENKLCEHVFKESRGICELDLSAKLPINEKQRYDDPCGKFAERESKFNSKNESFLLALSMSRPTCSILCNTHTLLCEYFLWANDITGTVPISHLKPTVPISKTTDSNPTKLLQPSSNSSTEATKTTTPKENPVDSAAESHKNEKLVLIPPTNNKAKVPDSEDTKRVTGAQFTTKEEPSEDGEIVKKDDHKQLSQTPHDKEKQLKDHLSDVNTATREPQKQLETNSSPENFKKQPPIPKKLEADERPPLDKEMKDENALRNPMLAELQENAKNKKELKSHHDEGNLNLKKPTESHNIDNKDPPVIYKDSGNSLEDPSRGGVNFIPDNEDDQSNQRVNAPDMPEQPPQFNELSNGAQMHHSSQPAERPSLNKEDKPLPDTTSNTVASPPQADYSASKKHDASTYQEPPEKTNPTDEKKTQPSVGSEFSEYVDKHVPVEHISTGDIEQHATSPDATDTGYPANDNEDTEKNPKSTALEYPTNGDVATNKNTKSTPSTISKPNKADEGPTEKNVVIEKNYVNNQARSALPLDGVEDEATEGHFFPYFLTIVAMCILGYVAFHNKQKIIALVVEGRHQRRRRSNGGNYRRLDNNLTDVMEGLKSGNNPHIIY